MQVTGAGKGVVGEEVVVGEGKITTHKIRSPLGSGGGDRLRGGGCRGVKVVLCTSSNMTLSSWAQEQEG